ncbi:hypothetical protein G7046_g3895 [Stylonectria norvegica]|nr:hypothetical protein G7046_g3895 [Stylonectria norvegica]
MAPAPNLDLPLQDRLLALAKTLQFAWFCGHMTLIITTIRYGFSWLRMNYYGGVAQFSYRTSFIAAALTYGIVVYKTQRARVKTGAKPPGGYLGILADENVQYLAMALIWLFSPQFPLALLPYSVYSIFHVATYTRANLIPVIVAPKPAATATPGSPQVKAPVNSPLADKIGAFVKEYYDTSMSVVSALEILLWIRLLLAAIFFQRRSWILIALYTAFLRARFSQSSHVQNSFSQLGARVDSLVSAQGTPPAARSIWDTVKSGAQSFHDTTDVGKYVNGAAPTKKTSSGPSQTYPQLAYRNPLDQLVKFLDSKHGEDWAIWEFRAEGTGYPDDAVYGRVRHYPWPDHHPPPFRLVPMIMASMRNWLHGGELEGGRVLENGRPASSHTAGGVSKVALEVLEREKKKKTRVVVVHCKAGKGRSGTASCSYLISEEGWTPEDAIARFTERRMRPKFGAGVSIPSQLRWIGYVDRWTRGSKKYFDRPIEIVEIHAWGLRNGVKVDVEGFADEGKRIHIFHTFKKDERLVVEGDAPEGSGVKDMMWEMAGYTVTKPREKAPEDADFADDANLDGEAPKRSREDARSDVGRAKTIKRKGTELLHKASPSSSHHSIDKLKSRTTHGASASSSSTSIGTESPTDPEPGGMAVILKPKQPIRIPNNDINISVERRNKTSKSMGLAMVTAVAHVWFNTFFEGQGPEQDGRPSDSGVFAIEWDAMDGIKGSSRKGARALDRIAVVWRAADMDTAPEGEEVLKPAEGQPVPQLRPADWKGASTEDPDAEKDLGLRVQSPASADVSKASSFRSTEGKKEKDADDSASFEGLKSSGPAGENLHDDGLETNSPHNASQEMHDKLVQAQRDVQRERDVEVARGKE